MKRKLNLQFFAENPQQEMNEETARGISEKDAVSSESVEKNVIPTEEASAHTVPEENIPERILSDEEIGRIYSHLARLEEETAELKESFPDFDLYRELKNPIFARLTAPGSGISAVDAYYAVHRKEIAADRKNRIPTENPAESPSPKPIPRRPSENGISGRAPAVVSFDYRNASREHRESLKKAIREAAARGEKIYPM